MKRILLAGILVLGVISISCDKQKAVDQIMADSEMKNYIIAKVMGNLESRAQLADSIFADKALTQKYIEFLTVNETTRAELLSMIMQADTSGTWIIGELSKYPEIVSQLKALPK